MLLMNYKFLKLRNISDNLHRTTGIQNIDEVPTSISQRL